MRRQGLVRYSNCFRGVEAMDALKADPGVTDEMITSVTPKETRADQGRPRAGADAPGLDDTGRQ